MRTYQIVDTASGAVLRTEEVDESIRPMLLAGQEARLLEVDGERLAKSSRATIGPGGDGVELKPMPEVLVTEAEASAAREKAKVAKEATKVSAPGDDPAIDKPTT